MRNRRPIDPLEVASQIPPVTRPNQPLCPGQSKGWVPPMKLLAIVALALFVDAL